MEDVNYLIVNKGVQNAALGCSRQGYSLVAVPGLLIAVTSLVVDSRARRLR